MAKADDLRTNFQLQMGCQGRKTAPCLKKSNCRPLSTAQAIGPFLYGEASHIIHEPRRNFRIRWNFFFEPFQKLSHDIRANFQLHRGCQGRKTAPAQICLEKIAVGSSHAETSLRPSSTRFRNVQWFRGGLVFEAHRLLNHSA